MIFNIDSAMKHSYPNDDTCFSIDVIDEILEEYFDALLDEGSKILHSIKGTLLEEEIFSKFDEFIAMTADENSDSEFDTEEPPFEKITINTDYKIKTFLEELPIDLELKPLPDNLEYVFMEEPSFLPVIISSKLFVQNKSKLANAFRPNAPATFQRYMLAIFHDMIEESIEHCKDAHLVLNWENCHFMVKKGIVLGYKVSGAGLEVDKAKIDIISKLPPPTNIKDTPFEFDDECQKAFELLKEKLTCAPVIVSPNWNLPFEIMCDASDFAVGAVLEISDDSEVDDNFPGETLMEINTRIEPWFADFSNYLVADIIAKGMTMPKALISERGTHFYNCNKIMEKTMKRYGVNHRFSTTYHPQTSGQVENTNMSLKRILEKTVKDNPAIWLRKLDDALWAFHTVYKTPTGTTP
ncbi:reverse transcriptase domain-containing protein [Tanacetum coccineum]